jgi:hypothetical protein
VVRIESPPAALQCAHESPVSRYFFAHADRFKGDVELGCNVANNGQTEISLNLLNNIDDRKIGAWDKNSLGVSCFPNRTLGGPLDVPNRGNAGFRKRRAETDQRGDFKAPIRQIRSHLLIEIGRVRIHDR